MRSSKLKGVILKRSNFGEADRIFTVFSREKGKIVLSAKGVRRIKSRRSPHLELFNFVDLVIHNDKIITDAKIIKDQSELKANLQQTGYLFYLAEILDKILPEHQPHVELFDDLINTIETSSSEKDIKKFVIRMMWILGYLPKGQYPKIGVTAFIETIAERKIKSKEVLDRL